LLALWRLAVSATFSLATHVCLLHMALVHWQGCCQPATPGSCSLFDALPSRASVAHATLSLVLAQERAAPWRAQKWLLAMTLTPLLLHLLTAELLSCCEGPAGPCRAAQRPPPPPPLSRACPLAAACPVCLLWPRGRRSQHQHHLPHPALAPTVPMATHCMSLG
jgi:hypothetical protein